MTTTIQDNRVNRNLCAYQYLDLCAEFVTDVCGQKRNFSGWEMTLDSFKTRSYRRNHEDIHVDVTLDFDSGVAIITTK